MAEPDAPILPRITIRHERGKRPLRIYRTEGDASRRLRLRHYVSKRAQTPAGA